MTLEGVEILHQTEILETPVWATIVAFIVLFLVALGVSLVLGIITDWHDAGMFIGIIVGLLCFFVILVINKDTIHTGRYRYDATIDKSVNFTELYEHYDIVEQRGEIYILEDKEK